MVRDGLLRQAKLRLQEAFGPRMRGVVVYGSVARREGDDDSDLDIMVLLDGPVQLGRDLETIIEALYPVQLECARPIHALPVAFDAFEAGEYAIYRTAKREGVFL